MVRGVKYKNNKIQLAEKRCIMKKLIILFFIAAFLLTGCAKIMGEQWCVKNETGAKMKFSEAKEITMKSDCVKYGSPKENYFCNEITGTWWIYLAIQKGGECSPACVINVETKQAEMKYVCAGYLK